MIKVKYISTDTDISSGLFYSQVKILEKFSSTKFSFKCISIKNFFYEKKLKDIRQLTGWPMRYSNNIFWILILLISAFFLALRIQESKTKYVYVGRGYYGGLIGYFLSKLGENFVWDPRSIYPLEMLGAGKFSKHSLSFKFWLYLEKKISLKSIGIIVVSEGHGKYYKRYTQFGISKKTPQIIVPCYGFSEDTQPTIKSLNKADKLLKKLSPEVPRIVYLGSLDDKWNNLSNYLPCFKNLLISGFNLIIMTQSPVKNKILDYLSEACSVSISDLESRIYLGDVRDETLQKIILEKSDCGIMLIDKVPDWFSRLSVKFAYYRCAGLPVILSKHFGGAINYLKKEKSENYFYYPTNQPLKISKLSDYHRKNLKEKSLDFFSPRNFYIAIENFLKK